MSNIIMPYFTCNKHWAVAILMLALWSKGKLTVFILPIKQAMCNWVEPATTSKALSNDFIQMKPFTFDEAFSMRKLTNVRLFYIVLIFDGYYIYLLRPFL